MNEDLLRRAEAELEKVRTSYMYDTDRGELYEQVTLLSRALVQMTQERDALRKELADLRAACLADYHAQLMAENPPEL